MPQDKETRYAAIRAWQIKNPHKRKEYRDNERLRDPEGMRTKRRINDLQWIYGLTLDQYHAIWEKQNEQCPVCLVTLLPLGTDTCVDHDHETKVVRGLLCRDCNRGIGLLQENAINLARASAYVAKHKAT